MAEPFSPYAGIEGAALTGGEGGDLLAKILAGLVQVPQRVIDATRATAPGLRREDYTDVPAPNGVVPWQPGDDMRLAANEAAMNLAGVGTSFAVPGAAGIFGGRLAATADRAALAEAEKMAAAGADRDAIWSKTGWFKGGDGKWRFEISDHNAVMNPNTYGKAQMPGRSPTEMGSDFGPIAGQVWHKDLYAAYPDARKAEGFFERGTVGGFYQAAEHSPTGRETIKAAAPTVSDARSVALHELQHLVQEREGFASGGSPSAFKQADDAELSRSALSYRRELAQVDPSLTPKQKDDIIRKKYEEIGAPDWFPPQLARDLAHDVEGNPSATLERVVNLYGLDQRVTPFGPRELYHELPGEVEARNVQLRADFTPEQRRQIAPWRTEDVTPRPIMNEIFGARVGSLEQAAAREMAAGPQMSVPSKPSLEELMAQSRRQIAQAEDLTKEAMSAGRMVFEKGDRKVAISPSLDPDYKWRVTNFDAKGPVGHREYRDGDIAGLRGEISILLGSGFARRGK